MCMLQDFRSIERGTRVDTIDFGMRKETYVSLFVLFL